MRTLWRGFTLNALATGLCALAGATTVTYNSGTNPATVNIPDRSTNFTSINVQVPFFDPSIVCTPGMTCTLNSVSVSLTGDVAGSARFESLDAAPATVRTDISATVSLSRPNGSTIVVTLPDATSSTSVTSYDGTIDFGGTSGRTFAGLTNSNTQSATLIAAVDLAMFTGSGMFALPVSAGATSAATGSGNLITQFGTQAGALVSVTYDYSESALSSTPEPATFAMVGGSLMVFGLLRRRARG